VSIWRGESPPSDVHACEEFAIFATAYNQAAATCADPWLLKLVELLNNRRNVIRRVTFTPVCRTPERGLRTICGRSAPKLELRTSTRSMDAIKCTRHSVQLHSVMCSLAPPFGQSRFDNPAGSRKERLILLMDAAQRELHQSAAVMLPWGSGCVCCYKTMAVLHLITLCNVVVVVWITRKNKTRWTVLLVRSLCCFLVLKHALVEACHATNP